MNINPRVAIYMRVSTDDQSTGMQRLELDEYIRNRKWTNVEFYEDQGLSGTNTNRPELKRLMQNINKRRIDIVLTWNLSRLFRNIKDLVNNLEIFQECSVSLISLKENMDMTSATGRLLIHIIGAFSEFEAQSTREKVIAGLRNARAKGKIIGRPKTRDDVKIHELREQGLSFREISEELKISLGSVQKALS